MRYFDFGGTPSDCTAMREIAEEYVEQMRAATDAFPEDMSEGERLIAWMLMVNAHALGNMMVDEPDEPWKD